MAFHKFREAEKTWTATKHLRPEAELQAFYISCDQYKRLGWNSVSNDCLAVVQKNPARKENPHQLYFTPPLGVIIALRQHKLGPEALTEVQAV